MPPINFLTSVIAVIGFLWVMGKYFPILTKDLGGFSFHIVRGVIGLMAVSLLRTLYWDIGQYVLGENWEVVRYFLKGQQASTLFNLLYLFPIYDFTKAALYTTPKKEDPRDG